MHCHLSLRIAVGLGLGLGLGVGACTSHDDSRDEAEKTGSVDLALTGTSASGTTYRLRNAELTINGGPAPIVFHTEDDPTRTLITQELDAGDYSLHVTPGWHLERVAASGAAQTVDATVTSPDPFPFTITPNGFTSVVIQFFTDGQVVNMTRGDVGISIGISEQTASCAVIHSATPSAADGIYTIDPGTGPIQVFCDMTHGGVTYEQVAFGDSFHAYPGYTELSSADLDDPVISQAFIALYNQQGSSLVNIDTTFLSGNCCIKTSDSGPNQYLFLGGHYVYPEGTDGSLQCANSYPSASYRFVFGDTFEASPVPLPTDYFASHAATVASICSDSDNPGWFFKRFGP
jgi:hypothetical protein